MALVERDDLLERLRSRIEAADGGAGGLVAVSGEAGAGKTSLVRAAVASMPARWGYCEPLSTPRPLGPFHDIARQLWAGQPDRQDLGVVEMRDHLLTWMLDSPVPLVVEDGHWIDGASADVLRFLGRRIDGTAGLIVVTFRDELGADHPLRSVLGDLATAPGLTRIDVAPLTAPAVARLVAGTTIDPDEAFRLTNGNPFLVGQLVLASNDLVTASTRDSVAARVVRLSPAARAAVQLLSVVPGRVSSALLGAEWADLDELVVGGLIRLDGPIVEFRHELVRLAVEQELPPGRCRELHAEVLRRMSDLDDVEPAVIAYHARGAHDLGLSVTSECAAAVRALALGSHRDAAEHYRHAVADATGLLSAVELSELWLALSREEYLTGHDVAARAAARSAVALRPAGTDPLRRGVAIRWLSRVVKTEAECYSLALSAAEILEPLGPSPELAATYAVVATSRMAARDLLAAQRWAERAIDLGTEIGDTESVVAALQALGSARMMEDGDEGAAHLRRALQLARDEGLDAELGRAYANFVFAAAEARRYHLSDDVAREALAYFVSHDLDAHADYTRAWHARSLFEQGRWAAATQEADEVLGRPNGTAAIAAMVAWCVRGRVRARRGESDVWAALDRAKRLSDGIGQLQRMVPVAAARAEARWLAGEADDGRSGLRESYELAVERSYPWAIGELGAWMWRHDLLDTLPDEAAEPYRLQVNGDPIAAARVWIGLGCPYEAADAWCDSDDEGLVLDALHVFMDMRAEPARLRAVRRLRDMGVRSIPRGPRATSTVDVHGLTRREQDVIHLLRAGDTDHEIAAKLHLSTKTVGHHVSAVLRKTGSRSRRDLRRPRAQRDLGDGTTARERDGGS